MTEIPSSIEGYRVESVLGRGASGVVLRVRDEALDRSVALKLLTDDLDADARARFLIEAKAAARIIHPNVVQVFAVGSHEGRSFITQELVEGYPLSLLLEAKGSLSPAAVIDVAIQVASGLAEAAEVGVLHRDVKPQNLLITEDGLVKLADFGLAKIMNAPSALTETGTTLGTPHYMSPEQGQGLELDPRSDQYSLGVMLYHFLCGRPPFDDENAIVLLMKHKEAPLPPVQSLAPECPGGLAAIVERMLAKRPEDRFASFGEVVEALEALAVPGEGHEPIRGLLEGIERPEEPALVEPPRVQAWLTNGAVALCALAVVGAAVYGGQQAATTNAQKPAVREEVSLEVAVRPPPPVVAPEFEAPPPKRSTTRMEQLLAELREPKTAIVAAKELGELQDHRATTPLIEAARARSERIAVAAIEALGALGDIQAIAPLEELAAGGRTRRIREAAERAKRRLYSVDE